MGRVRKRMYTKDGPVDSCMLSSHSTEFPDPELTFSGPYCACADGSSLRGNYGPPRSSHVLTLHISRKWIAWGL